MSSLDQQLVKLRACIKDKPPYYSGTLSLSPYDFILYYGKNDGDIRSVLLRIAHMIGQLTTKRGVGALTSAMHQRTASSTSRSLVTPPRSA